MGNPFGLGGTVTGGPLFTQDGKVVGINTAILSPTGGSVGIGFAIPSDTVKTVVAQLEKGGHVTRGYLGVEAQQISQGMVSALHIPSDKGALVAQVQPNSPASKSGL